MTRSSILVRRRTPANITPNAKPPMWAHQPMPGVPSQAPRMSMASPTSRKPYAGTATLTRSMGSHSEGTLRSASRRFAKRTRKAPMTPEIAPDAP